METNTGMTIQCLKTKSVSVEFYKIIVAVPYAVEEDALTPKIIYTTGNMMLIRTGQCQTTKN